MKTIEGKIPGGPEEISEESRLAIMRTYLSFINHGDRDGWDDEFQAANFAKVLDLVINCGTSPDQSSLIDVGCGSGKLAQVWSDNGGPLYTGIDILLPGSPEFENLRINHPGYSFVHGEFTHVAVPPADFVVASGSLSIGAPQNRYEYLSLYLKKMMSLAQKGIYLNYWEDDGEATPDVFLCYESQVVDLIIATLMKQHGFVRQHRQEDLHTRPTGGFIHNHVFIQRQ